MDFFKNYKPCKLNFGSQSQAIFLPAHAVNNNTAGQMLLPGNLTNLKLHCNTYVTIVSSKELQSFIWK